jgi:hypothetical protein
MGGCCWFEMVEAGLRADFDADLMASTLSTRRANGFRRICAPLRLGALALNVACLCRQLQRTLRHRFANDEYRRAFQ